MKIEILGGKDEIGGNKILIEHKGTRIMLDFGISYKTLKKYFSEFLNPRKCSGLKDYQELGLLPDIKGIYREDYLKHQRKPTEEKSLDAVFITHAHADHAGYIHFLRQDIPIYSTTATKIICKVLQETGTRENEYMNLLPQFKFYTNTKGTKSRLTRRNTAYIRNRDWKVMNEPVQIGCLRVHLVPVDHSLPGACGFIIESDEGKLAYTGDIRFHGEHSELSRKFVETAKGVKWLISEGTNINDNKQVSEADVQQKISEYISRSKGLVMVEHPIRDIDRINSILKAAKKNGREFAVPIKLAYLINELGDLCPFSLDEVKIFVPRKSWGLITSALDDNLKQSDYDTWEKPFVLRNNSITYKDLVSEKYVLSMSLWDINQLVDINPVKGIWIKSSCEPFSEEMELDEERKNNWLEHFNIKKFSAHASGHASGNEIKAMIKQISPEILIPVHTEHSEMF